MTGPVQRAALGAHAWPVTHDSCTTWPSSCSSCVPRGPRPVSRLAPVLCPAWPPSCVPLGPSPACPRAWREHSLAHALRTDRRGCAPRPTRPRRPCVLHAGGPRPGRARKRAPQGRMLGPSFMRLWLMRQWCVSCSCAEVACAIVPLMRQWRVPFWGCRGGTSLVVPHTAVCASCGASLCRRSVRAAHVRQWCMRQWCVCLRLTLWCLVRVWSGLCGSAACVHVAHVGVLLVCMWPMWECFLCARGSCASLAPHAAVPCVNVPHAAVLLRVAVCLRLCLRVRLPSCLCAHYWSVPVRRPQTGAVG